MGVAKNGALASARDLAALSVPQEATTHTELPLGPRRTDGAQEQLPRG